MQKNPARPYFLWDYDLTEDQVREIAHGENAIEKQWIMARILTSAKFGDVWKYLTVADVSREFPKLRLRPGVKRAWQRALTVWGYHV
jgi:hypothetical protein